MDLHLVERDEGLPYYEALLAVGCDESVIVTRRYGSWMIETPTGFRHLTPAVAADLQDHVKAFERRVA